MLRAALTGGIATGKSFCLVAVRRRWASPSSTPTTWRARRSRRDRPALTAVVRRFGRGVLLPDGALDRDSARPHRLRRSRRARRSRSDRSSRGLSPHRSSGSPTCRRARASRSPTSRCSSRPATSTTSTRVVVSACEPDEQLRRLSRRAIGLEPEEAQAPASPRSGRSRRRSARADYVIMHRLARSRRRRPRCEESSRSLSAQA